MTPWHDYKNLYNEYIMNQKSTLQIAKEWGCSSAAIQKTLLRHKIPTRKPGAPKGNTNRQNKTLLQRLKENIVIDKYTGCFNWIGGCFNNQYGRISICGKDKISHIVIWELYYKTKVPQGCILHHQCRNKKCCNPKHLKLMTRKEHCNLHIKEFAGENHTCSKYSNLIIVEIKKTWEKGGISQKKLAQQFGMHQGYISRILANKIRKYDGV